MGFSVARCALPCLLVLTLAHAGAFAQTDGMQDEVLPPVASDGGTTEVIAPRPVGTEADSVNRRVAAETVDGLVLAITIDGESVRLDSAMPARVPRKLARAEREADGDAVVAIALVNGQVVGRTVVPDTVINASEGEGLVRTPTRQIALVLATGGAVDTVTIEAPATGAKASLDVRAAYAEFCRADPNGKWCPRGR